MTMAMAWGLTSGTIMTLVFIPCAYSILEDWFQLVDNIKAKFTKDEHSHEEISLKEVTTNE